MSEETGAKRRTRDVLWTTTTYIGEGLPWSVLHQMATEFLTAKLVPVAQVGYTSIFHLSVTLKFLWSPIVDLFSTKRRWLISMQLCLGLLLLLVAGVAEANLLRLFWLLLGLFSIFHATHDVACDGFYLLAFDRTDQALYSGVRVAAFRAAMILGGGGLVYVAGRTSWLLGFGLAGLAMMLLSGINALLMPTPDGARRAPAEGPASAGLTPRIKKSSFLEAYRTFFTQSHAGLVLAFIFFYRLGDIMMFAMSPPLLRDLGLDTSTRGLLRGIGTLLTVAGSMIGGWLIARYTLQRLLVPIAYFQNLAIILYIILALGHFGILGITLVVMLEQLASGVGNAGHVVFLMQRCRATFSAAHYAFATAVVALASTLIGVVSGHLNAYLGHPLYFTLAFACSWPSLVLVLFVPRRPVESET